MKAPSFTALALAAVLAACSGPNADSKTSATIDVAATDASATASLLAPMPRPEASPADRAAYAKLPEDTRRAFENADVVVAATLADAKIASVLEIAPPIFVHEFDVVVADRIGGAAMPARVTATWSSRDRGEPLENGKPMLVALRRIEETMPKAGTRWEAMSVTPSTPELERAVGTVRAPAPDALAISVAQVPSAKPIQWDNDYGDGEFDVTITNRGATPIEVPRLYATRDILWRAAVVVRDEPGKAHTFADDGLPDGAHPVVLAPGAAITTRLDVKAFAIEHPAGGSRYYYSFSVGELRVTSFFYYTHTLHGPMMGHR